MPAITVEVLLEAAFLSAEYLPRVGSTIEAAIAQGTWIVISTRMPQVLVLPLCGYKCGSQTLKKQGTLFADSLSPQKARILLTPVLQKSLSLEVIQRSFCR